MSETQEFERKWRNKAADAYQKHSNKPINRILWEVAISEDEDYKAKGKDFDLKASYLAWISGWMQCVFGDMAKRAEATANWESERGKVMRTPQEIEELIRRIDEITDWPGTQEGQNFYDHVHNDENYVYLMNVSDALSWVIGQLTTGDFITEGYLNLEHWQKIRDQFID
jgi:hypothetical protein